MRQILPHSLWLGHAGDASNLRAILDSGIAALVDLAIEERPPALTRELICCRFPLVDGTGNSPHLLRLAIQTVASLVGGHIPTLVSCGAGLSRAPSIAAAALALVSGQSCEECLVLVRQAGRADVSPGLWQDVLAACAELTAK
ncbi:MAG: hypothetical protein L0Z62_51250 [Gemmataceae bacterium]|nr:hypothetical protein [Gemmataceae bacterium]